MAGPGCKSASTPSKPVGTTGSGGLLDRAHLQLFTLPGLGAAHRAARHGLSLRLSRTYVILVLPKMPADLGICLS
jgi:hypothetical protein